MTEANFESMMGRAIIRLWAHLPRDVQEELFDATSNDTAIRNALAIFLHEKHPRTMHPPRPTSFA